MHRLIIVTQQCVTSDKAVWRSMIVAPYVGQIGITFVINDFTDSANETKWNEKVKGRPKIKRISQDRTCCQGSIQKPTGDLSTFFSIKRNAHWSFSFTSLAVNDADAFTQDYPWFTIQITEFRFSNVNPFHEYRSVVSDEMIHVEGFLKNHSLHACKYHIPLSTSKRKSIHIAWLAEYSGGKSYSII